MQRLTFLVAIILLLPAVVLAQCPPAAATSICSATIIDNDVCPTVIPPTLVWCPAGDLSLIELRILAIGAAGIPCTNCTLEVRVNFTGLPNTTIGPSNIWLCNTNAGPGSFVIFTTTDAVGEARIKFSGGGCGCISMSWTVVSLCGNPTVICQGVRDFCIKSPDFTGDGMVNFFDTFKYLPQLSSGFGYCADFNCDGVVNFFDTFQYLPHLSGGHSCIGSAIPFANCSLPCN